MMLYTAQINFASEFLKTSQKSTLKIGQYIPTFESVSLNW